MEIRVCSQWELEALAGQPFDAPTALISIGDIGSQPPTLLHRPQYTLRLEFDDVLPSPSKRKRVISVKQAREIAAFVYTHKDSVQTLICQCGFGFSRSAAVAAAVKEHFIHGGLGLFVDGKHHPTVFVFSAVLEALKSIPDDFSRR